MIVGNYPASKDERGVERTPHKTDIVVISRPGTLGLVSERAHMAADMVAARCDTDVTGLKGSLKILEVTYGWDPIWEVTE
jgi:hypothetical protein